MEKKPDFDFIKMLQKRAAIEPTINPGETALEAIQRDRADKEVVTAALQRMEKERLEKMGVSAPPTTPSTQPTSTPPQSEAKEVVFYQGYKLSRDFFTCIALCIMKLDNPETNEILKTFGFEMKDLAGKPVILEKKKKKKKK